MLAAAKRLVGQTEDAHELAADSVLVICDVRDPIAAAIAAAAMGLEVNALRDSILSYRGEVNPMPFVGSWEERADLVSTLTNLGFGVPGDWAPALAHAPRAPGWFWILLKRDGRGLLLQSDLSGIAPLQAPAVLVDMAT